MIGDEIDTIEIVSVLVSVEVETLDPDARIDDDDATEDIGIVSVLGDVNVEVDV